jgi:hypothetical protein
MSQALSRSAQELLVLLSIPGRQSGKDLRGAFNAGKGFWSRYSGPGFYSEMVELELKGLVSSWKQPRKLTEDVTVNLTWFEITEKGQETLTAPASPASPATLEAMRSGETK